MKRANGTGTIVKLTGNRRRPYAIKITLGYTETGKLQYKYLSYHKSLKEAQQALAEFTKDPYTLSKYTFKQIYDEFYAIQEQTKAVNTLKNHKAAINHLQPLWDVKISPTRKSNKKGKIGEYLLNNQQSSNSKRSQSAFFSRPGYSCLQSRLSKSQPSIHGPLMRPSHGP